MIRSWEEFDRKLREVALIDIDVAEAGRARDLAEIETKTQYERDTKTRLAARAALEKEMEKFYRANRKEVEADGRRSKELRFGRVGIRATAAALKLAKGAKWDGVAGTIARLRDVATKFLEGDQALPFEQFQELAAFANGEGKPLAEWKTVIPDLREWITRLNGFLAVKVSVAKPAVKAAKLSEAQLDALGLRAKAGEEFFVETFPEKAVEEAA